MDEMLDAERSSAPALEKRQRTLRKGDRIELLGRWLGMAPRGTVYYVDDLQILVKWDDGRSQSLRAGNVRFRIVEDEQA